MKRTLDMILNVTERAGFPRSIGDRSHGDTRRGSAGGIPGLVLLVLLALAAVPASAELVPVGETLTAFNYIDADTVDKKGDLRNVWVLIEYKEKTPSGAISVRSLQAFDCAAAKYTMQSSYDYSEARASGRLLRAKGRTDRWTSISPASVAENIGQLVCTK
ncbi:MAG: hypothetical protein FJY55_12220 [Betaproteobacteria bacterium]|nr:hypothetical protein [Betaproteobacteria bacterium]